MALVKISIKNISEEVITLSSGWNDREIPVVQNGGGYLGTQSVSTYIHNALKTT